jgi:hypothetical protein
MFRATDGRGYGKRATDGRGYANSCGEWPMATMLQA